MTRINCIPPSELTDAHLGAEYRELPRVFSLVSQAIRRKEQPDDKRNPLRYTLGEGHVRFFYNKLGYLVKRYGEIVQECKRRGRVVRFASLPVEYVQDNSWYGQWEPDAEALALNRARINERLNG